MLKPVIAALVAVAAPAAASVVQAPSAPAEAAPSEAQIARFIAALPDQFAISGEAAPPSPELLARLQRANPGRDGSVAEALAMQGRCITPLVNEATLRMFGRIALRLGAERVERMIRFYEGPDFLVFKRVVDKSRRNEALSDADDAEVQRILAAHPLAEFHAAFEALSTTIRQDDVLVAGLTRCAREFHADLDRRNLRLH